MSSAGLSRHEAFDLLVRRSQAEQRSIFRTADELLGNPGGTVGDAGGTVGDAGGALGDAGGALGDAGRTGEA